MDSLEELRQEIQRLVNEHQVAVSHKNGARLRLRIAEQNAEAARLNAEAAEHNAEAAEYNAKAAEHNSEAHKLKMAQIARETEYYNALQAREVARINFEKAQKQ